MSAVPRKSGDELDRYEEECRAGEARAARQTLWGFGAGDEVATSLGNGRVERVVGPGTGLTPGIAIRIHGRGPQELLLHVYRPSELQLIARAPTNQEPEDGCDL